MTEKQKSRQCCILDNHVNPEMFVNTYIPPQNELNAIYGNSNQNTIWNNLPIPLVENFSGIAYVNPVNMLRYLFAHGVEMDDFTFQNIEVPDGETTYHLSQSAFAVQWQKEIQEKYPDYTDATLAAFSDWKDGFGANRTKQNRKSTVAWTGTFSTPRSRINSISNTRLIALGLKKNAAWSEVEHRFEEDMRQFGNGLIPIWIFNPRLGKQVPVFVRRFACLTDKVERADYTATMACTSNYHRHFGKIIQIDNAVTPDTPAVKQFLSDMKNGSANHLLKQYDWSSKMLTGNTTASLLPACSICRKNNIDWLKRKVSKRQHAIESCDMCANWKVNKHTAAMLVFPAPTDYPKEEMSMLNPPEGVRAPTGRSPTQNNSPAMLQPIDCTFQAMIQGTRFAFFNAMSPGRQQRGWNQAVTKSYLRTLGINAAQQDLIYKSAAKAFKESQPIDWNNPYYVGDYRFPAAWVADLQMPCYIELLMHLLFLGVTASSFEQCSQYFTKLGKLTAFKKQSNRLLHFLHGFNLSWLLAYPFAGTKLTTGAWVS